MSKLKVVNTSETSPVRKDHSKFQQKKIERTALYERLWKEQPDRFDYQHTSIGRHHFEDFKILFYECNPKPNQRACDLACGKGTLALFMVENGLEVDAIDIASNALDKLKEKASSLHLYQEYVPYTQREDSSYDIIVCTDFIGELHAHEYRLLISELARLVKAEGHVICSTPLDSNSEDPLSAFIQLMETEFEILNIKASFDRSYLFFSDFLAFPGRILRASLNPEYRLEGISKRRGLKKLLFKSLSNPYLKTLWKPINFLISPLSSKFDQSETIRKFMARMSEFLWQENSVTHVITLAKRRALFIQQPEEIPQEQKRKKTVWE